MYTNNKTNKTSLFSKFAQKRLVGPQVARANLGGPDLQLCMHVFLFKQIIKTKRLQKCIPDCFFHNVVVSNS